MIQLHRLNGADVVLNAELIESIEAHGNETVINLATGNRLVVKESVADVTEKALEYRRTVYVNATYLPEFLRGKKESTPSLTSDTRGPDTGRRAR